MAIRRHKRITLACFEWFILVLKIEEYSRVALNNCVLVKMAKNVPYFQVKKNISVILRGHIKNWNTLLNCSHLPTQKKLV